VSLHFPDKWVWDFWFAQDGPDYHMFYLQADRALGDPQLRHNHASIGHAVSRDLRDWEILPDALAPSKDSAAWDSFSTWTGSIIRHQGVWHMFYTGARVDEAGLIQRIGLATSDDLNVWRKHPGGALIEADPRWYELLESKAWHDQAWRDPFVFQHTETGEFHALITGRVNDGMPGGRGVIACAKSADLVNWEVTEPLTPPGEFGQMEVPQIIEVGGRYYLLFSTNKEHHSAARQQRTRRAVTGTHYLVSEGLFGPYRYLTDTFMIGDPLGLFYSGKAVQDPNRDWQLLAFRNYNPDGMFVGDITDPMPLTVDGEGLLHVEVPDP
jgi:beta-fructofuranosidase